MVHYRTQGFNAALLIGELVVVSAVFWFWVLVWDSISVADFSLGRFLGYNELLVIGLLLAAGGGPRRGSQSEPHGDNARAARRQALGGALAVALVMVAGNTSRAHYAFLMSFALVSYVVLRVCKHYLPRSIGLVLFGTREPDRVLIVGAPEHAQRLAPWLRAKESVGLRAVGLVYDEPPGPGQDACPVAWLSAPGGNGDGWDQRGTEWLPRLPAGGSASSQRAAQTHAVGSSATATTVAEGTGLTPMPAPDNAARQELPWLGPTSELSRILDSQSIRQVLVLGLRWPEGFLRDCVTACEHRGVRLHLASDLDEYFRHTVTILEDTGIQLIALREEPLESPLNRLAKRIVDVVIALPVVLLVLPPMTMLVWLLHRWQSPGPVFFRQFRSGLQGRKFQMVKFRTMTVENDDETRQVKRGDARLFPAGYWLRRFSLDELPQFLNVLRGDMSVVGPRPHIPAHDDLFTEAMQNYRVRSAVKPGITGLAQVRGFRGGTQTQEDIVRRVTSDIEYLERWTLELDLWIIFRTFWQVVFPPRNAY